MKSDLYFIAVDMGGNKLSVLHTAQLLDVMRTVTDMVMQDEDTKKVFVDFNQAGRA